MLIRCDKCSTLYELDASLLPLGGAPVQCSKCQYVFTAYRRGTEVVVATSPPAAADGAAPAEETRTPTTLPVRGARREGAFHDGEALPSDLEGELRADGTDSPEAAIPPPEDASAWPTRGLVAHGAETAANEPKFTPDGRPIRKVVFPAEEQTPVAPRPPLGLPKAVKVEPAQRHPVRVLLLVLVAVVILAALGWFWLNRRSSAHAEIDLPQAAARLAQAEPPKSSASDEAARDVPLAGIADPLAGRPRARPLLKKRR